MTFMSFSSFHTENLVAILLIFKFSCFVCTNGSPAGEKMPKKYFFGVQKNVLDGAWKNFMTPQNFLKIFITPQNSPKIHGPSIPPARGVNSLWPVPYINEIKKYS